MTRLGTRLNPVYMANEEEIDILTTRHLTGSPTPVSAPGPANPANSAVTHNRSPATLAHSKSGQRPSTPGVSSPWHEDRVVETPKRSRVANAIRKVLFAALLNMPNEAEVSGTLTSLLNQLPPRLPIAYSSSTAAPLARSTSSSSTATTPSATRGILDHAPKYTPPVRQLGSARGTPKPVNTGGSGNLSRRTPSTYESIMTFVPPRSSPSSTPLATISRESTSLPQSGSQHSGQVADISGRRFVTESHIRANSTPSSTHHNVIPSKTGSPASGLKDVIKRRPHAAPVRGFASPSLCQ